MNFDINTSRSSFSFRGKIPNINKKTEKIQELAARGKSLPQISRRCDIPYETLRNYLGKSGVQTVCQRALHEVSKSEILKLVNQGYTTGEISCALGIDVLTADKLFKKFGIKSYNTLINESIAEYVENPSKNSKTKAVKVVDKYLQNIAKSVVSKNEACSYDDYLQNLRLDFLNRLEECREGIINPSKVIFYMKQLKPTKNDLYLYAKNYNTELLGSGDCKPISWDDIVVEKPKIKFVDLDNFYSEDKNILSFENSDYNSRYLRNLLYELTCDERTALNARYGIYNYNNVKRGYEFGLGEIQRLLRFKTKDAAVNILERAKRSLRDILNEKRDLKAALFDSASITPNVKYPPKEM